MRPWRLIVALALGACSPPGDPPSHPPDPPKELVVHPAMFRLEGEPLVLLSDGDPLQLWSAVQGGHVALIAAQIEGIGGDTIELRARFTDLSTSAIVAEEARTVVVRPVPDVPGLKQNDIRLRSQMTHVPLCPNYDPQSLLDRDYLLTVTVTELYTEPPRKGSAQVRIRPTCGELAADVDRCQCECEANYTLGKCH